MQWPNAAERAEFRGSAAVQACRWHADTYIEFRRAPRTPSVAVCCMPRQILQVLVNFLCLPRICCRPHSLGRFSLIPSARLRACDTVIVTGLPVLVQSSSLSPSTECYLMAREALVPPLPHPWACGLLACPPAPTPPSPQLVCTRGVLHIHKLKLL